MRRLLLIACLLCLPVKAWAQEELTVTTIHSPASTDLTLKPTSDLILSPTGAEVLPSTGYSVNLGRLTRKYLALHAAELWVETLVAQNTIATIGGRVLVGPTSLLTEDFTAGAAIMVLKHNSFVAGDHVYMESDGRVEFMAITAGPSAHTGGGWEYSVSRNLDGSGSNDWSAGSAIFDTGQAGNGFIDLYSVRGVKRSKYVDEEVAPSGTEIGPTIVGNVRTGSTYNAWEPRWAIGNLDGLYGYTGSTYGSAFGVPGGARVTMDATNGIRMFGGDNDEKVTIDTSGVATFDGRITVGTSRNMIRNSECRVSTADWSLNHNTGLTTALSFNLPSYRLMDVSNTCYIQVTGTPVVGTLGQAIGEFQPAGAGLVYEASAYLGNHRTATSAIILQFYNAAGTVQTGSATGSLCTEAMGAGGTTLAGYCRSTAIATAPVGTSLVRVVVQAVYDGVQANPFMFFVRTYLAEGKAGQTQVSEWGPAGITEIIGGLIRTDAIDARTIAADAITASELAANSITAADIQAGTITSTQIQANGINADRLNVSTLSAITGNMGTLTAGSITGGTIDGATINAGSGDEVVLNSSGITISNGTGTNNRIKWGSNIFMYGTSSGLLWLDANEIFLSVGGGGTPNVSVSGGIFQAQNGARFYNQVDFVAFQGSGNNRFVCHDNNGVLYSSGTTCDGSSPDPATVADLKDQIEALRAELAALRAERRQ